LRLEIRALLIFLRGERQDPIALMSRSAAAPQWIATKHAHVGYFRTKDLARANPEINFRNGGIAEGSLARRGGKPIPIGLGLPTQHSQRPLAAPALSQAILSEVLGRRPGRNGLSAASSAQTKVYGHWPLPLSGRQAISPRPFGNFFRDLLYLAAAVLSGRRWRFIAGSDTPATVMEQVPAPSQNALDFS
jgi:hypothetical protein